MQWYDEIEQPVFSEDAFYIVFYAVCVDDFDVVVFFEGSCPIADDLELFCQEPQACQHKPGN